MTIVRRLNDKCGEDILGQNARLAKSAVGLFTSVLHEIANSMQVKTSITLSGDLPHTMDELIEQLSKQYQNRSVFLEMAAWAFIEQLRRAQRTAKAEQNKNNYVPTRI